MVGGSRPDLSDNQLSVHVWNSSSAVSRIPLEDESLALAVWNRYTSKANGKRIEGKASRVNRGPSDTNRPLSLSPPPPPPPRKVDNGRRMSAFCLDRLIDERKGTWIVPRYRNPLKPCATERFSPLLSPGATLSRFTSVVSPRSLVSKRRSIRNESSASGYGRLFPSFAQINS